MSVCGANDTVLSPLSRLPQPDDDAERLALRLDRVRRLLLEVENDTGLRAGELPRADTYQRPSPERRVFGRAGTELGLVEVDVEAVRAYFE